MERKGMRMDGFCALLAVMNLIESALCLADLVCDVTPRNFVAWAAWVGSTVFWVVRGWIPR